MEHRVLGNRYELLERIGSGGMAVIWRARDRSLHRAVAVKILHENLAQDPGFVERFRGEARHAAALSHENVVTVYDTGSDGDRPYIVMELVEGRTLHDVLRSEGPLPGARAVHVGEQILAALSHAHARGLVHRDVKPGNVLITPDGVAKVTDFGIAKALDTTAALTQTGTLLGTAAYISPEQALGRPATELSDLYAVGCVLYECLSGHPPFTGDNPVAVAVQHQRADVPPLRAHHPVQASLERSIMRALSKDPADRPQSAEAMRREISGLSAPPADQARTIAVPAAAPPVTQVVDRGPGATEVIGRPPPRNRLGRTFGWVAIALLAGAVLWLLAAILTVTLNSGTDATPTPEPTAAPTVRPSPSPRPTPSPTPQPTAEPDDDGADATPEPTFPFNLPGLRGDGSTASPEPTPEPSPTPTQT